MKQRWITRGAAALLAATACLASAQDFPRPGKPIRVLIGFAAGGPTDTQARAISNELAKRVGVPVLVENKPGASGALAAAEVARAEPDGHTLLYTVDGPMTQTPHLLKSLPYDPLKDFTPMIRSAIGGVVLVAHPSLGVDNVKGLVAYARANPGKVSYASFGTGTVSHIYGAVLAESTGTDMTHVPYKGSAEAMRDLIAGRVQIMFDSPSIVSQYANEGKLKVLGAVGSKRRIMLPNVPTLLEQGYPGFEIRGWNAFFAPPGMRAEVLQKVHAALRDAQASSAVVDLWNRMGFELPDESAARAAEVLREDHARWRQYIAKAGVKME